MKKIIYTIFLLMIFTIAYTIPTYASGVDFSWSSISGDANGFIETGKNAGSGLIQEDDLVGLVTGLGGILTVIGVAIVFVGFMILGIKYMMATPEEAAKLKTKLIGLVVAGIVIVGAWGIWNLALTFFNSVA